MEVFYVVCQFYFYRSEMRASDADVDNTAVWHFIFLLSFSFSCLQFLLFPSFILYLFLPIFLFSSSFLLLSLYFSTLYLSILIIYFSCLLPFHPSVLYNSSFICVFLSRLLSFFIFRLFICPVFHLSSFPPFTVNFNPYNS